MVTIEELTVIRAPLHRCFDLARSIEVHLAGTAQTREPAVPASGLLHLGQRVTWRARHFGVWQTLTSEITQFDRPHRFQDTMAEGIFRSLVHDHLFRSLPSGETEMRDVLLFAAPIPGLGRVAEILFLRRYMQAFLRERNAVLRKIAESPVHRRQYLP